MTTPFNTSVFNPASVRCDSFGRFRLSTKASVKVGNTGFSKDFVME
jgi:hypothetical protein